jgi:hypothetical protein
VKNSLLRVCALLGLVRAIGMYKFNHLIYIIILPLISALISETSVRGLFN